MICNKTKHEKNGGTRQTQESNLPQTETGDDVCVMHHTTGARQKVASFRTKLYRQNVCIY